MLWLVDPEFGLNHEAVPSYFDKKDLLGGPSFLDQAATGKLPAVSWIDPNFYDLTFGPAGSNDDHPPSDLHAGQELILRTVDAVMQSPNWPDSLLIITYDEHGGFFDHVPPPTDVPDDHGINRYGPRVPAIVVSPWVEKKAVSQTVFDHTSIIKTILSRFCADRNGRIPDMGARVRAANHLGELLTRPTARRRLTRASYHSLLSQTAAWHEQMVHNGTLTQGQPQAHQLSDFQADFLTAKHALLAARKQIAAKAGLTLPAINF